MTLSDQSPLPGDPSPSASTPSDPPDIPPHPDHPSPDASSDVLQACGIAWDYHDIARFLFYCRVDTSSGCLIWTGAKSKGHGKNDWYGSFWLSGHGVHKGKTIRAHKFYAVAVLGHRPKSGIHQLDHVCSDTLCVRHLACVPADVNRALQWIRVQVGLEEPPDHHAAVVARLELYRNTRGPDLPEWEFNPDIFDPRFWSPDIGILPET